MAFSVRSLPNLCSVPFENFDFVNLLNHFPQIAIKEKKPSSAHSALALYFPACRNATYVFHSPSELCTSVRLKFRVTRINFRKFQPLGVENQLPVRQPVFRWKHPALRLWRFPVFRHVSLMEISPTTASEAPRPKISFFHPPWNLVTLPKVGKSVVKNSAGLPMGGKPFFLPPWYSYVPSVSRKNPTLGVPAFFLKFFLLREQICLRALKGLRFKGF